MPLSNENTVCFCQDMLCWKGIFWKRIYWCNKFNKCIIIMTIVGESSAKTMIWNEYIKIILQVSKLILMTSFKNHEIKELKYLELLMLFSFFFFYFLFKYPCSHLWDNNSHHRNILNVCFVPRGIVRAKIAVNLHLM